MRSPDLVGAAREYLAVRRALGFRLENETWYLPDFVAFLARQGSSVITAELAVRWAQQRAHTSPSTWAKRLTAIRGFANHVRALDSRTAVLPRDLVPWRTQRPQPYIYSKREIRALMREARCSLVPPLGPTYSVIIGLLAATGMRLGEVLALEDRDVDWSRSLLEVRRAKFGKSRLVPVAQSTLVALRRHCDLRSRLLSSRTSRTLFVSTRGTRIARRGIDRAFVRLLRLTGIHRGAARHPRLHDLRHTFAVTTMREWYRAGFDVESRLPALSTYLGHVNFSTTYWYLTATPDLLALAGNRLERHWKTRS